MALPAHPRPFRLAEVWAALTHFFRSSRGRSPQFYGLATPGNSCYSLFMDALSERLRSYLTSHPEAQIAGVAKEFHVTEGKVLAAVEGELSTRLKEFELFELAEEMASWGRVRLVVRNGVAVSEMLGSLEGVRLSQGWLTVENDHFHLHLKADEIKEVYLLSKKGHRRERASYSVQFLDRSGAAALKVFLLETAEGSPQVAGFKKLVAG